MPKFRKKPVIVEAVQWTGENLDEIEAFAPDCAFYNRTNGILIDTLEGLMEAKLGDWIIKGVQGEFYPCKPDIFAATYEPATTSIF